MKPKVVLVVEDNKDELMIYTTLLAYRGYEVLSAADFDTALQVTRDQLPDLVVELRKASKGRSMPVIAHTAFGDVYRQSLERVGCDCVIHKPTNPQVLLDTVEQLIGKPLTLK